ncbi:MAG: hypothetical protein R3E77_01675 [Steroidobacteraceae bacterium]
MRHRPAVALIVAVASLAARASTPGAVNLFPSPTKSPSCSDAGYSALDGWLGEWRATDVASGTDAGRATISRDLGGCVILERWNGLGADGKPYDGFGIHRFEPASGHWIQNWFGDQADAMVAEGSEQNGGVVYERQFERDGVVIVIRQHIEPLADGRFSNRGERSTDGGTTWQTTFNLVYDRLD